MSAKDLHLRLQRLAWPAPGDDLRARVLSAVVPAGHLTWADRVWFSRAWRLTAAAAVAGLVAVEAMSVYPAGRPGVVGRQVVSAPALALFDLRLPAAMVETLTSRGPDGEAWPRPRVASLPGDPR